MFGSLQAAFSARRTGSEIEGGGAIGIRAEDTVVVIEVVVQFCRNPRSLANVTNEQQSCSDLTGFPTRSERCCG
jgi:hypothetical protein